MNTEEKFQKMIAYDFNNLNLQQVGNDNCYTCDECDNCNDSCDNCDSTGECNCDNCNTH